MKPLVLVDGTKLLPAGKPDTFTLGDDTVVVEREGNCVTVRLRKNGTVIRNKVMLADGGWQNRQPRRSGGRPESNHAHPGDTQAQPGRWRTLNRFMDDAAPNLGSNEIAVWAMLFRHADKAGIVKTSVRRLAGPGRSFSTVSRAIARLERLGLLKYVRKAKHRGEPSVVRLTTTPKASHEPLHG